MRDRQLKGEVDWERLLALSKVDEKSSEL